MRINICVILILANTIALTSCFGNNEERVNFIIDESGHKMYRNEDGIYIKNEWYEIDGNSYYFDANGYLATDKWVNNDYFVDESGKKKKNYWIKDDNKLYYLGDDGKYYRDGIFTIDKKEYCFNEDGSLITDSVIYDKNGNLRVSDSRGVLLKEEGIYNINKNNENKEVFIKQNGFLAQNECIKYKNINQYYDKDGYRIIDGIAVVDISTYSDVKKYSYINKNGEQVKNDWVECLDKETYTIKWCYANDEGFLLQKEWLTYKGNDYYFDENCYMSTNRFINNEFYVDENGKKVKDAKKRIDGKDYSFDNKGYYNKGIITKTENENWELKYYSTGNKYIINKKDYKTQSGIPIELNDGTEVELFSTLVVDKSYFRIYHTVDYGKQKGKEISKIYSDGDPYISMFANGNLLLVSSKIDRVEGKYLVLTQLQKYYLLNALNTNGNKIRIELKGGVFGSLSFEFMSDGFNEIYPNLIEN